MKDLGGLRFKSLQKHGCVSCQKMRRSRRAASAVGDLGQLDVNLTKVITVSQSVRLWKCTKLIAISEIGQISQHLGVKTPQRIVLEVLSLTSSNDFFFGYVARVDFSGKLHDSSVGVLICVWIHVGFQRL